MKCPSCKRNLIDVATTCRCGWKKADEVTAESSPACAWCDSNARIALQTPEGWVNVCEPCYEAWHGDRARASVAHNVNLDRLPDESRDAWRIRVRGWLRQHATIKRFGETA